MSLAPKLICVAFAAFALAQPALAATPAKTPHGTSSSQWVQVKTDNNTAPQLTDAQKRAARAQAAAAARKAGGCATSKPAGDADFSFQGFGDSGGCSSARR